jgi:hydroxypyruvate isomerase
MPSIKRSGRYTPQNADPDVVQETLHNNLRFAAKTLKAEGIKLLVEPINTFDIPGFVVSRTRQVLAMIRELGCDNLYVQYDIYHMQRMEESWLRRCNYNCRISRISNWQIIRADTSLEQVKLITPSCSIF